MTKTQTETEFAIRCTVVEALSDLQVLRHKLDKLNVFEIRMELIRVANDLRQTARDLE